MSHGWTGNRWAIGLQAPISSRQPQAHEEDRITRRVRRVRGGRALRNTRGMVEPESSPSPEYRGGGGGGGGGGGLFAVEDEGDAGRDGREDAIGEIWERARVVPPRHELGQLGRLGLRRF